MKILILCILLMSCNAWKKITTKEPEENDKTEELTIKKVDKMNELAALMAERKSWPSDTDCDATLWAGQACYGGLAVDIKLAEYEPGIIHRRPAPACWNEDEGDVGSKSTVSNDMVLGYIACLWSRADYSGLSVFTDVSERNNWQIGKPLTRPGEVILKPNQQGLLGRMLMALASERKQELLNIPPIYTKVSQDFERHIQIMGIQLYGEVHEELKKKEAGLTLDITQQMLDRLRDNIDADPRNYFFHAVNGIYSGDMSPAIDLLLADDYVPTYVRGAHPHAYRLTHWIYTAEIVLKRFK